MAELVSSMLFVNTEHEQVSGIAMEFERVDFQLANDEAVEIMACDFVIQQIFPQGTDDALYQADVSLDPNIQNFAVVSGQALNDQVDGESIWSPRVVKDLTTSGAGAQVSADYRREFPPNLIVAQDLSVGFNSNNVGADMLIRTWYRVVRLTEGELLTLIARRRAR